MSRITEAIERIGGVPEASRAALDLLARRRARRQRRRRVEAGVLSVAVVVGGFFGITTAVVGPHSAPAVGPTSPASGASGCLPPGIGHGPGNHPRLSPVAGPPGSTVTVSGEVSAYGPGGTYVGPPMGSVQVWWNLDPTLWWTALPGASPSPRPSPAGIGAVLLLGTHNLNGACPYQIQVTVPNVPPGTYPIVVLHFEGQGQQSDGAVTFTVSRSAPSPGPQATSTPIATFATNVVIPLTHTGSYEWSSSPNTLGSVANDFSMVTTTRGDVAISDRTLREECTPNGWVVHVFFNVDNYSAGSSFVIQSVTADGDGTQGGAQPCP